jgi:hypothetical protein
VPRLHDDTAVREVDGSDVERALPLAAHRQGIYYLATRIETVATLEDISLRNLWWARIDSSDTSRDDISLRKL